MRLDTLLERLEYKVVQGSAETEVTTLINDSRKVENGSVFVCISGAVSDGHKYAAEVAEKGAAALVVEKDVEVPADVTVIKCTGTDVSSVFWVSDDRLDRSDQPDLMSCLLQNRLDHISGRRLSFCTGNSHNLQLLCRIPKIRC